MENEDNNDAYKAIEQSIFNNPDPNHLKEIQHITNVEVIENPGN